MTPRTPKTQTSKSDLILVGDENEGYTYAHIKGIQEAAKELGMTEDQLVWKYTIPEDATCTETALDLVDQGCNLIISNSYGHQSFMEEAASQNPEVTFVSMTGDTAARAVLITSAMHLLIFLNPVMFPAL